MNGSNRTVGDARGGTAGGRVAAIRASGPGPYGTGQPRSGRSGPYPGAMTSPTPPQAAARERAGEPGLATAVALYTLARLGLLAAVTVVLALIGVPWLVALLVALVVALPLSMVLFRGLRERLDRAIAASTARRSSERASLRAQLRGDVGPPPSPDAPVAPASPGGSPPATAGADGAEPSAGSDPAPSAGDGPAR